MFKCLFGHRYRMVYRNPYSCHPVSVTRPHPTKTVSLCGKVVPDLEFKVRCGNCDKEIWK